MKREFICYGLVFDGFDVTVKALKQFRSRRFEITPRGNLIGWVEVKDLLRLQPVVIVYGLEDESKLRWILNWLSELGFSDYVYELVEAYKSEGGVWTRHSKGFYRV